MGKIVIMGDTMEKKFKHLESVLSKMSRKLHKTVVGTMPPIPLFFFSENAQSNGDIFQWLFPVAGVITRACLYIREYADKDGVQFSANMIGPTGSISRVFDTRKHSMIQNLDIPVNIGDRLVFGVATPERVKGIWVAFLLQMNIRDLGKEAFLVDEFSTLMDKEVEEITTVEN